MTYLAVRTSSSLFKITVLSASLLLAACGSSRPGSSLTPPAPVADAAAAPQPQEPAAATLSLPSGATRLQPGVASGGRTQSDAAADGGVTVALLGNGHAATFTVPAGGTFTAALQARQTAYQGNAVLSLRVNGTERRRVELTSTAYAAAALGDLTLAAGDVVSAALINDLYGGVGQDRNAYVDYLTLTPAGSAVAPAPAPTPAPAPAPAPTPTPTPAPTPAPAPAPAPATGVDVRTFGAKGDGVTDDTAALQRAASSKQSLYFPPGTYRITGPLSWADVTGLSISGERATLRSSMTGGTALLHFNRSQVTLSGLTLVGAGTGTGWIDGVRLDGDRGSVVRGLTISAVGGAGITVQHGSGTLLEGNTISQTRMHGIWGNRSSQQIWRGNTLTGGGRSVVTGAIGLLGTLGGDYLIEGNLVREYGNTGTKTEGASNVTYRGNTVDGFAKDGIKIMPYPEGGVTQVTNGVLENNTVRGFSGAESNGSSALQLSSVLGGRVSGNTTYGSFGQDAGGRTSPSGFEDAIRLQAHGSGPQPRDIVISGNTVVNSHVGLRLMGQGNTVSNNVIQRSAQYSVIFNRGASGNTFSGNTFSGAGSIGVLFDHEVSGTTFSSNTFSGMNTGIYAANSGNNNNTFRGNAFSAVTKAVVLSGSGNTCTANTGSGVSLSCQ